MEKKKFSFDLDDYDDEFLNEDEESSEELVGESIDFDSEENYNDFNNIIEVEDSNGMEVDEIEDDETRQYTDNSLDVFNLSIFYTWFTRIGIGIAVILMALFITKGDFLSLFKYVLLLIGSFFAGYFAMFLFDKLKENN